MYVGTKCDCISPSGSLFEGPAFTDVAKKNLSTKCGRLKTNMNIKSLGLCPLSCMYIDPWNTVCVP